MQHCSPPPAASGQGRIRIRRGRELPVLGLLLAALPAQQTPQAPPAGAPTLEETRLAMGKWLETQQIIARERKEWQQAKEVLQARLELVQKEVAALEGRIQAAEATAQKAEQKKRDLQAENAQLQASGERLHAAAAAFEADIRQLLPRAPEPVQQKLQPLFQRLPADPATVRISSAERLQNVLGILDGLNKANTELLVNYEVRQDADGRPAEVRVLYLGLAQAWYVGASGNAGCGRPGDAGWTWQAVPALADQVAQALEIIQGKLTPAFVPLPVRLP